MEVNYYNEEIPLIIVDNFYTEQERNDIMVELDYLSDDRRMIPPHKDKEAAHYKNVNQKNAKCQYLDSFFQHREHSSILQITEKIFQNNTEIINNHPHWFYDCSQINAHWTHIIYYEHNEEYKPHKDTARMTVLTYFYREPKRFEGGHTLFPDYDIQVECKNNRILVFPSNITHASVSLKMDDQYRNKKNGKFCITQFLNRGNED